MRVAELVMAVALAVFSLYLMWKSAELPIGWDPDTGPGGGAFPFWLSAGMLACCAWIIVRWARRQSPPSRSGLPYMDKQARHLFLVGAGSLTVMIGLTQTIGIYFAVLFYLFFYIRYVGRHSWRLTGTIGVVTPIVTFFFFEIALKITLPKGWIAASDDAFMNEWVYFPLFDIFL